MPRYVITGSNGKRYRIEASGDDEAKRQETWINDRIANGDEYLEGGTPLSNTVIRSEKSAAERLKNQNTQVRGAPDAGDLFAQGAMLGLGDEASGVGNAINNVVTSPFTGRLDPSGAYATGRDAERLRLDEARANSGWAGTAAEVGGGFLSAAPSAAVAGLQSLGQVVRTGARQGATAGGIGGFGYGEGGIGSLISAGLGAVGGGIAGAVLPVAVGAASNLIGGARRAYGANTGDLSRQIAGEALTADGGIDLAAARMAGAGERGTPLALADTGENARELLASVSRRPGTARTIATTFARDRQMGTPAGVTPSQPGQYDRTLSAVADNLGPIANVRQQSADILSQGRARAAPLYEEAYAQPGATSPELEAFLATPAGRTGLARARTIAANEQRNPDELGLTVGPDGEAQLTSIPTQQTLDYIKRGLDSAVDSAGTRDPLTGRLDLDTAGRAVDGVRRGFIAEVDQLNPAYAAARAEAADYLSANEALDLGRNALNLPAEEIEAATGRMGQTQREQFALGFRAAMADNMGRAVDGADQARRMLGSPRKRAALQAVFGDTQGGLDRFLATMVDEQATNETYRSVMTGSQTALRQNFDGTTNDAGLAETATNVVARGVSNPFRLLGDAVQALGEVGRFGAGQAGNETREGVAALLSETNPEVLRDLSSAIREAVRRQRRTDRVVNNTAGRLTGGVGLEVGSLPAAVTRGE